MMSRVLFLTIVLLLVGATLSVTFAANTNQKVVCPPTTAMKELHFQDYGSSPFFLAEDHNMSTFALDVDRASYDVTRMWLNNSQRPPTAAIRPEEFVNALSYNYPAPDQGISLSLEGTHAHPFAGDDSLSLLRVAMQSSGEVERGPLTLIVCLDRSGSMQESTGVPGQLDVKFELALELVRQLADTLEEGDRFGLVSYAPDATLDLKTTAISTRNRKLPAALGRLSAGGGTNLFSGLHLAYEQAAKEIALWPEHEVAIILISDGAANIGTVDHSQMLEQTESFREQGIRLSTIGLGLSTLNDEILEQLGDKGDGQYIFLGYPADKERVIATAMTHLLPIALEARSQLEFDPTTVRAWRQIGFENRVMSDVEFSDNTVDAGEVGSDQSVTVLYEIVLNNKEEINEFIAQAQADNPEQEQDPATPEAHSNLNIATARVRWQDLNGEWTETEVSLTRGDLLQGEMDEQFRAAVMMARWAQLLRGETDWDLAQSRDAYIKLLKFAFADASAVPGDPEFDDLRNEISDVRALMALDFELGSSN